MSTVYYSCDDITQSSHKISCTFFLSNAPKSNNSSCGVVLDLELRNYYESTNDEFLE